MLQEKCCKCCLSVNELWEAVFHLKATLWFQFCSVTLTPITSHHYFKRKKKIRHLPVFFFFFFTDQLISTVAMFH